MFEPLFVARHQVTPCAVVVAVTRTGVSRTGDHRSDGFLRAWRRVQDLDLGSHHVLS